MTANGAKQLPFRAETAILGAILAIGLVHALLYVYLVPPWQHYDEPNHFEIVWLTAKLGRHPKEEDIDPQLSRSVVQSMVDHGFYSGIGATPDLSPGAIVGITGYRQFDEPPLYYFLASLPLRLFYRGNYQDIDNQLHLARLISTMLYLVSLTAAWGTARTLAGPGHALRWLLPAMLVGIPGFTDLMTAVNNDVAAVASFCIFFWGATRLMKSGFTLVNFIWVAAAVELVIFSKNTAYVALLLFPIVVVLSVIPQRFRRLGWAAILACMALALILGLRWDDASHWHRATAQIAPLRQKTDPTVLGDYAMALDLGEETNPSWVPPAYQVLPLEVGRSLGGKGLTFGVWMWADKPVQVKTPIVGTPVTSVSETVKVDPTPKFFAMQVKMPETTSRVWVALQPRANKAQNVRLFYDGFVLAEGTRPLNQPPNFDALDGSTGEWGGEPFTNLLRNGSIEASWPRVEPHLDNLATRLLPDGARPTLIINSLLDLPATGFLYRFTAQNLLRTFWGTFGWGHVRLIWPWVYTVLTYLSLAGFLGAILALFRGHSSRTWDLVLITGLAGGLIWFDTMVRGIGYFTTPAFYVPPARYAFPAIIPTAAILMTGWLEIIFWIQTIGGKLFRKRPVTGEATAASQSLRPGWISGTLVLILVSLDILSIITVIDFYRNILPGG
jgi:hypothetical protein